MAWPGLLEVRIAQCLVLTCESLDLFFMKNRLAAPCGLRLFVGIKVHDATKVFGKAIVIRGLWSQGPSSRP